MQIDLHACLADSKDAWDQFVRQSAPVIYAAVRRALRAKMGNLDDLDDRVQDVYVRLFRDDCKLLRTFDPRRASLVTWLTLIARTVVHEHQQRKRLPTFSLEGYEAQGPDSPPPRGPDFPELPLGLLSRQQRHVLELLFERGLSVEQAAQRLGVEAQTIRSAKHKALTRLREHFAQTMTDSQGCSGLNTAKTQENNDRTEHRQSR